jgi:hypothetical protein
MTEYKRLSDVVIGGCTAIAVFTDGRHLDIDHISKTGNWRISPKRSFEKVVVYYRCNNVNTIILGDYIDRSPSPDPKRFIVRFSNAKEAGFTRLSWSEFAETGTNPVKYIN